MDRARSPLAAAPSPARTSGHALPHPHAHAHVLTLDERQPLLGRDPARNEDVYAARRDVLFTLLDEAFRFGNSHEFVWVLTVVNVPQIVAAAVILALKWTAPTLCYRVQVWVLLHTLRMTLTLALEWGIYVLDRRRSDRSLQLRARYMRNLLDLKLGVCVAGCWVIIFACVWIKSDDGSTCDDGSTMYQLAWWMFVICIARMGFPSMLVLVLAPGIVFCLPCMSRVASRLHDPMRGKGASREAISRLPTKKFTAAMFPPEDSSCCICLNEYKSTQELRVLPCEHHFHKDCVDAWLVVNSTCPSCRESIIDRTEEDERPPPLVTRIV